MRTLPQISRITKWHICATLKKVPIGKHNNRLLSFIEQVVYRTGQSSDGRVPSLSESKVGTAQSLWARVGTVGTTGPGSHGKYQGPKRGPTRLSNPPPLFILRYCNSVSALTIKPWLGAERLLLVSDLTLRLEYE